MESKIHTYNYDGTESFSLIKWKTRVGSQLLYNSVILSYKLDGIPSSDGKDPTLKYKSNVAGTVVELLAAEGDTLLPGAQLLKVQPCTHPVTMKDLCAECGTDLRQLDRENFEKLTSTTFSMVHVVPELKVCLEQAEKLGKDDETRLLKNKKLVLLVDLDQTLIHTTNDDVPKDLPDVHHFQLYGQRSPWYHTKLRPGTKTFLENVAKHYELHICTFGARMYAHKIAQILDPDQKLFSHRILSRDECFDATSKTGNLKALFPRGDNMVCIIDDREDVWNYASNVIHVKPYCYFHNTGDINAPPFAVSGNNVNCDTGTSVANTENSSTTVTASNNKQDEHNVNNSKNNKESNKLEQKNCSKLDMEGIASDVGVKFDVKSRKDNKCKKESEFNNSSKGSTSEQETKPKASSDFQSPESESKSNINTEFPSDDYLLYLEEILQNIHKEFYKLYDKMKNESKKQIPDLKVIVPELKSKVLKNCNIVFSCVIPTNVLPETSRFWTLAESLGAHVFLELILNSSDDRTTHVISSKLGTTKVNTAKKHEDIFIVGIDWLFCCAERWERADERLFTLKRDYTPPVLDSSKQLEGSIENPFYDLAMMKSLKGIPKSKRLHSSSKRKSHKSKKDEEVFSERIFVEAGLSLSQDDIEDMDREIEEACSEESEKDSQSNSSDSSEESLSSADYPKGWKRPRKNSIEMDENEVIGESSDAETIGSVDEEIAEAVKQEFGS